MKKKKNVFENSGKLFLLAFYLTISAEVVQAQSVQRQSIGSAGTYMMADGIMVQQTVGQSYSTMGFYSDELSVHPGFQQSMVLSIQVIDSPLNMHLSLYPNPTSDAVMIECSDVISDATLQVIDASGKVIFDKKISDLKKYQIECESWNNGFYFISIIDSKDNKYSSKLIISK